MARYEWAKLTLVGTWLMCTDPPTLMLLADEVKKLVPTCVVDMSIKVGGEPFHMTLSGLKSRQQEMQWYMMKLLCHMGWEPYAADGQSQDLRLQKDK